MDAVASVVLGARREIRRPKPPGMCGARRCGDRCGHGEPHGRHQRRCTRESQSTAFRLKCLSGARTASRNSTGRSWNGAALREAAQAAHRTSATASTLHIEAVAAELQRAARRPGKAVCYHLAGPKLAGWCRIRGVKARPVQVPRYLSIQAVSRTTVHMNSRMKASPCRPVTVRHFFS